MAVSNARKSASLSSLMCSVTFVCRNGSAEKHMDSCVYAYVCFTYAQMCVCVYYITFLSPCVCAYVCMYVCMYDDVQCTAVYVCMCV
jgi:hypothetical protein